MPTQTEDDVTARPNVLGGSDSKTSSGRLEVAKRWLLENDTRPVGGVVDMSSGVIHSLNKLGALFEVTANLDQRLSSMAAGAISARVNTLSKCKRTSQSRAGNGRGKEGNGEFHVGWQKVLCSLEQEAEAELLSVCVVVVGISDSRCWQPLYLSLSYLLRYRTSSVGLSVRWPDS